MFSLASWLCLAFSVSVLSFYNNSYVGTTFLPSLQHMREYVCVHAQILEKKSLLYLLNLSLSPQNLVSIPLGE